MINIMLFLWVLNKDNPKVTKDLFYGLVILLTLLISGRACAAITEVGGGSERDGIATISGIDDSVDLALTNGVTSGDKVFVGGTAYDATSGSPSSITVTAPCVPSFTVLSSSPAGATRQFIAYGTANSTGACTVTVNPQGTQAYISFGAVKFTGVGALDVDDGETHGTDLAAFSTITTTVANALILAVITQGTGPAVLTPDGSITEIAADDDAVTVQPYAFAFRLVTTVTSYDMEWAIDSSVAWKIHTASFAPAGAAVARRRVVTP